MERLKNKQGGMSALGFMTIMVLLAVAVAVGLKLLPMYIEHYNVVTALDGLKTHSEKIAVEDIKPRLLRNFSINDVKNVGRQHIKIRHINNKTREVSIDYEVRRTLMGNVDVVVHFADSVELTD